MTTLIEWYAELTGGSPTPGPDLWIAAAARVAALVPAEMAAQGATLDAARYPEGLAAIAVGTYITAATGDRPRTR